MLIKPNNKLSIFRLNTTLILIAFLVLVSISSSAQNNYIITHNDSLALENVIVEKYYISDSIDYADTTGGILPKGSVTYRIYIDMKPGYLLQTVYGNEKHELFIKTSTKFFNNKECLASTGFNIDAKKINDNTVALDSWITMGAATRLHTGILKSEDKDGSLIHKYELRNADGLTKGTLPLFKIFNIDLNFFNNVKNAVIFSTNDGGWAAPGGVKGPTDENRVIIAQLTTDGILTFGLNIQIGTPSGGFIQFVGSNPEGSELKFDKLLYN
jgi:hypothetical protein